TSPRAAGPLPPSRTVPRQSSPIADAGEATPAASDPSPPAVPGYEIEGVLGRGGMGVVWKARHLALKRPVALKMVLLGSQPGLAELARFQAEAEAVARLQPPNIVQVFEGGQVNGQPCWRPEYGAGGRPAQE